MKSSWVPTVSLILLLSPALGAQTLRAHVSMDQPQRHFLQVRLELSGFGTEARTLVLPTWTPGSYKIRDFSRNVESFRAHDGEGAPVAWSKQSKNRWRLDSASDRVVVEYDYFAFESSVRNSWLDDRHAFLMPGGIVPYVEGFLDRPIEVILHPPEGWIADTALEELGPLHYRAEDYDRLVDCPIQVGTHQRADFEVDGTLFRLTLTGEHNMDVEAMTADMAKVVGAAGEMFGGFPFQRYCFLTRFGGGGGLEHADSTALMSSGWRFDSRDGWRGFLGLVAHEFFHAWNVKRIRDKVLGPFDYEKEVYTRLLWVHEGWTNYYADQLLLRAGILSADDLRRNHERLFNSYLGRPGRHIQSLAQASFDAWIKFYQTNETTQNSTVSYYSHGQVAALCFDLILRGATAGERSLDDVLQALFEDFAQKGRGIEESDVRAALVRWGGAEAEEFWQRHVVGVEEIDIARWVARAGLSWSVKGGGKKLATAQEASEGEAPGKAPVEGKTEGDATAAAESAGGPASEGSEVAAGDEAPARKPEPWKRGEGTPDLGMRTRTDGASVVVQSVDRDSAAWDAGFDLGDELIGLDGRRVTASIWPKLLKENRGEELSLLIARRGRLLEIALKVPGPTKPFALSADPEADDTARAVYQSLFGADFPHARKAPAEGDAGEAIGTEASGTER